MIEEIRKIIRKECNSFDWECHIVPVVKYAKILAKNFDVMEETVEVCALLHDIGRIRFGEENHEITGISEAEKILKKLNYPSEIISEAKHCIESHRAIGNIRPRTLIAKIVANADAMAHIDFIIAEIYHAFEKEYNFKKAIEITYENIKVDWDIKLNIPEAREMIRKKYEAFNLIFDSILKYIEKKKE